MSYSKGILYMKLPNCCPKFSTFCIPSAIHANVSCPTSCQHLTTLVSFTCSRFVKYGGIIPLWFYLNFLVEQQHFATLCIYLLQPIDVSFWNVFKNLLPSCFIGSFVFLIGTSRGSLSILDSPHCHLSDMYIENIFS